MGHPGRLDRASVGLVVIDLQTKMLGAIPRRDDVVRQCLTLAATARALSLPVVVTEQYPVGLGSTLPSLLEALPGAVTLEKETFSCFGEEAFTRRLDELGLKSLILCGVEAHVCVYQTALDALDRGFRVYLAGDAVGSRREDHRDLALRAAAQAGAAVLPAETLAFDLLVRAGTPEFKAVHKFIR